MSKIQWDDSLSVGVKQIDEQHKMLIQKLKDLSDAFNKGLEHNKILQTLDFMIDYTDFHFSTEEGYMAEQEYPGLALQKAQHNEFKLTLNNILEDYREEGPTTSLAESINVFLFNWLIKHIQGVDAKLGEFFAGKGITDIE